MPLTTPTTPLTAAEVDNARPRDDAYTLRAGDNLSLLIKTNGTKIWRYRYTLNGRERACSLGTFPAMSLKDARRVRDVRNVAVARGEDFIAEKKAKVTAERTRADLQRHSLESVARAWFAEHIAAKSPRYSKKVIENLERNAFPVLGHRPITSITRADIRNLLNGERPHMSGDAAKIPLGEKHKLRQFLSAVFRYAIHHDIVDDNPPQTLVKFLPPKEVKHYRTITEPRRVGALLRAIDDYSGTFIVGAALRLLPYVFVRPGELRGAEWAHIDLDSTQPEWRIPANKMKSGVEHRIPLSKQATRILRDLKKRIGGEQFVFPGVRPGRPISDNTLNAALRTLGYSRDDITAHGFRAMASTLLNEKQFDRDAIESQLAHGERDKTRAAYNHATKMDQRRKMMQAWADYLDDLRNDIQKAA